MQQRFKQGVAVLLIQTMFLSTFSSFAAPTTTTTSTTSIQAVPPNVYTEPARPLIMLNMSKDHQLFYRAYNEYSDYDNDPEKKPDGGYLHTVQYSGYFDSTKCYTYSTANGRFQPSAVLANRSALCSGAWHGNFLNWATMTRMDVVRKVLYGGHRSTDTSSLTVLERASLPMDAHSFAKYYVNLPVTATAAQRAVQPDVSSLTPFTAETEITLCNTTLGDNTTVSHTNANPPLLRAARGNFSLWNAHERRQCRWSEENQWNANGGGNGNDSAVTGFGANGWYPSRDTRRLGDGDLTVRVEVCNASYQGEERCRAYPSGSLKPIGLLQEYGENDQAEFGLMTGSFSRNTSGGVLRKNASSFTDEVNHTTDGTFRDTDGIVRTLNRLKVYGFRYSDAIYAADDNPFSSPYGTAQFCGFQTIGLRDNTCSSWGNPIGEMYIDTLRYLAGRDVASNYGSASDAKGTSMNLTVATPIDPLSPSRDATHRATFGAGQCRPINVVNFNASVISYDKATRDQVEDLSPFAALQGTPSLSTLVNRIGTEEGIDSTMRFAGSNGTTNDSSCTAKMIGNLWSVQGLCPTAPAYRGSFSLAGAAYFANTNPIRAVPTGLPQADADKAFRVRTYAVALAPGVPRIEVRTQGSNARTAVIQPSYRLDLGAAGRGSGTMVDFRVISQNATNGSYLIVWEDSEQGGDYDSDVTGILEWSLAGDQLQVTTRLISQATANPQGFGYTISGTNADGEHFHSGILNFNYTDAVGIPVTRTDGTAHTSINASGGCNNCNVGDAPSRATYTVRGNPAGTLKDPMWYAAKWGGFRNASGTAGSTPATTAEWDAVTNATGAAGADGEPDTYFEVFNPEQLERSLRLVFSSAVTGSNATPAISSAQLTAGSLKYVASFDADKLNGDVKSFSIGANGFFNTVPNWSAGAQLTRANHATRRIITNNQTQGISFDWTTLTNGANDGYISLMTGAATPSAVQLAQAQRVVRFVRGDDSVEGTNGIRTRTRVPYAIDPLDPGIMGPIVSASPWIQGRPNARFLSTEYPGYGAFVQAQSSRPSVLWTAANDGMLHAASAQTGEPIMSYVPEGLVPRLSSLTTLSDVIPFVDGSPFSADVEINNNGSGTPASLIPNWRTYTFGTLGRGGRAVFALDTTDTAALGTAAPETVFKWQFTANDDADLGYVLSDIGFSASSGQATPVVKLQNGQFAVVIGNGAGSTSGKSVLFILPVQGPNATGVWGGRYYKIELDSSGGSGLSTPTLLDTNNDGMADTAYAGDLKGNLWKIDLSGATTTNWRSAYRSGGTALPLYIAKSRGTGVRLPITGAPQFSFSDLGGVYVTFATGRSVANGDFPRLDRTQSVFGIWDRPAFATGGRALPSSQSNSLATLVPRTMTRVNNDLQVTLTGQPVTYVTAGGTNDKDGWYFHFQSNAGTANSEMAVSNMELRLGMVLFTTIRPPQTGGCATTVASTLYAVDPANGLPPISPLGTVEVTLSDGSISRVQVAGVAILDQRVRVVGDRTTTTGTNTGTGISAPVGAGRLDGGTGGTDCSNPDTAKFGVVGGGTDARGCLPASLSRFQWREIPGLRTK